MTITILYITNKITFRPPKPAGRTFTAASTWRTWSSWGMGRVGMVGDRDGAGWDGRDGRGGDRDGGLGGLKLFERLLCGLFG